MDQETRLPGMRNSRYRIKTYAQWSIVNGKAVLTQILTPDRSNKLNSCTHYNHIAVCACAYSYVAAKHTAMWFETYCVWTQELPCARRNYPVLKIGNYYLNIRLL